MPQCGCTSPCNCSFSEDGYWAERSQDGRRNTVVSGMGTPNDPFTVSFIQSEFFRPSAGELKGTGLSTTSGSTFAPTPADVISVYQSPETVMISIPFGSSLALTTIFGNYFVMGASATFAANATGLRRLVLLAPSPMGPVVGFERAVTGVEQNGHATRPTVLSVAGFYSGMLEKDSILDGVGAAQIAPVRLEVFQNSGSSLTLTEVKFWAVMI